MSTLRELSILENRGVFASSVAKESVKSQKEVVGLNHGFKTPSDVINRIHEGNSITFDYDRLMEEADKYV